MIGLALLVLPGCSELAQTSEAAPPSPPPSYTGLVAKYLQTTFNKNAATFDGYEISPPRWVHSIRGWTWLVCVHFHDHGPRRSYVVLIQDGTVVDSHYAVETDTCESQTFTPFDLATGELGRSTLPTQQPLY